MIQFLIKMKYRIYMPSFAYLAVITLMESFPCFSTASLQIIAAYLGWQDCRNDRHEALRYGDMTSMDESILQSIASYMEANRILYTWEKGDIMAINNQLVMHSRNPFQGTRKVLASIWDPCDPPCCINNHRMVSQSDNVSNINQFSHRIR
jgi:Taurine catabolism dioxygenase TauD, TfdA family